jgi:hypothetical protein
MEAHVRAVIADLEAGDEETALLDLAEISEVLSGRGELSRREYPEAVFSLDADGESIAGKCYGPDAGGRCPWADSEGHVPCGGIWMAAGGWSFKVAEDSTVCPLHELGLGEVNLSSKRRAGERKPGG